MTVEPLTRRCARCWIEKPLTAEHFGRTQAGHSGRAFHCRDCGRRKINAPKLAPEWLPVEDGMAWT